MEIPFVGPRPLARCAAVAGAVKVERKKLITTEDGLSSDVHADNGLNFSGQSDTAPPASRRVIARRALSASATLGANIEIAFPSLKVRLVAYDRNGIAAPSEKLDVVAHANNFLGFLVNVVNAKYKSSLWLVVLVAIIVRFRLFLLHQFIERVGGTRVALRWPDVFLAFHVEQLANFQRV